MLNSFSTFFICSGKRKNIIKYQAMYCGKVDKLKVFNENDEMDKIELWDLKTEIGDFDEADRKMIELCLRSESL